MVIAKRGFQIQWIWNENGLFNFIMKSISFQELRDLNFFGYLSSIQALGVTAPTLPGKASPWPPCFMLAPAWPAPHSLLSLSFSKHSTYYLNPTCNLPFYYVHC